MRGTGSRYEKKGDVDIRGEGDASTHSAGPHERRLGGEERFSASRKTQSGKKVGRGP